VTKGEHQTTVHFESIIVEVARAPFQIAEQVDDSERLNRCHLLLEKEVRTAFFANFMFL